MRIPATNQDYWVEKLERNRARDERNLSLLKESGWLAMTAWECELRDMDAATGRLVEFLER